MINVINNNTFKIDEDNIKRCCPHLLTEEDFNSDEVQKFCARKEGSSLQDYIRKESLNKHNKNEEKCYLIKIDNHVVAYFTICTDLIVERDVIETLPEENRIYVNKMIKVLETYDGDIDMLDLFKDIDNYDELVDLAHNLYTKKCKMKEYKETTSSMRDVTYTYPSLAIKKFCKNIRYQNTIDPKITRIGTYFFWMSVMEVIKELNTKIGFVYVSIFASEKNLHIEEQKTENKLINYYRNELKFKFGENSKEFFRTYYDRGCEALYQSVDELYTERENYKKLLKRCQF